MIHHLFAGFLVLGSLLLSALDAAAAELVISKGNRRLEYKDGGLTRVFPIGLGATPAGKKLRKNDQKTPEGLYYITHKNTDSKFNLSLGISYPNLNDARAGFRSGMISKAEYAAIEKALLLGHLPPQQTALGGDISIHGNGAENDWTRGCIALDDNDMKFLFEHVQVGDMVTVLK